jgi:glycosyltransferase involved in cell wall biosynthesis
MHIAFLTSHPIQYQAPLFRLLARRPGVQLTALFCHDHGVRPTYDPQFGKVIGFDVPLLEGYEHRFLRNMSPRPGISPLGLINPEVLRLLNGNEYDALIVHGYSYVTTLMGLLGPRRRTRVLLRGESNLLSHRGPAKRVLKQLALRAIFGRVDHFLPIGSLNAAYYGAYGVAHEHMTLAPYSVDNAFFASRSAGARQEPNLVRQRLGLPESRPLFLFAAKLIAKKRPLDAVRAFARAREAGPAALVYVGDGELAGGLRDEIERLGLARDVYLLGFRNQTELPEIYGACDVLVLPSGDEPWGLVVNEAMACGTAAVVSDQVGSGPDLVTDRSCVFPAGDIGRLADVLRRVILEPAWLAELKAAATRRIRDWGLEQTADGVLRGAESALARAHS